MYPMPRMTFYRPVSSYMIMDGIERIGDLVRRGEEEKTRIIYIYHKLRAFGVIGELAYGRKISDDI